MGTLWRERSWKDASIQLLRRRENGWLVLTSRRREGTNVLRKLQRKEKEEEEENEEGSLGSVSNRRPIGFADKTASVTSATQRRYF